MKKGLAFLMVVLCVVMGGGFFYLWQQSDKTGPEINFPAGGSYYAGMSDEELLENVTAKDDKDGDVTDSLIVERVFHSSEDNKITVVYTAKDSSNNVSKKSRKMEFSGDADAPLSEKSSGEEDGEETPTPTPDADITETPEPELTPEEETRKKQEALADEMPDESPRVYLTDYYAEIPLGQYMGVDEWLDYVEDIQDDVDNVSDLWRAIQLDGEVDTYTEGTYELAYYVTDSEGNSSNRAVLKVVVKDEEDFSKEKEEFRQD